MSAFTSPIPRPEHPRPDFHRGLEEGRDWLNLNGPWEFAFDPEARGEAEQWFAPGAAAFDRWIIVPFCWESHLAWGTEALAGNENWFSTEVYLDPASVTRENYRKAPRQTIGWYRRSLETPELVGHQRLYLHIGAADWQVKVWVNGSLVAEGESGYVPFSCDLTEALAGSRAASLVIRVEDPQGTEDKPLGKQHKWYTTTSGIWQTVWLEVRPERHIPSLHLTPKLSPASVLCEAQTKASSDSLACQVTDSD